MPEELWTEVHDFVQEAIIKTISKKKKCKKTKGFSEDVLQLAKKREVKEKGEKERYTYFNSEFQRMTQRHTKAFLRDHCKELEKSNRMERLEIS